MTGGGPQVNTGELMHYFSKYGKVDYCEVEETEKSQPTNHGVIKFYSIFEVAWPFLFTSSVIQPAYCRSIE